MLGSQIIINCLKLCEAYKECVGALIYFDHALFANYELSSVLYFACQNKINGYKYSFFSIINNGLELSI